MAFVLDDTKLLRHLVVAIQGWECIQLESMRRHYFVLTPVKNLNFVCSKIYISIECSISKYIQCWE